MLMIDQNNAGLRGATAASDETGQTPWPALIEKIQANDATGMEELYRVFSRGVRFFLWRQLGKQDLDDTVHDTFLTVAEAIQRGEVREPDRLMGFVWTVVRRQLAAHIERAVNLRNQRVELDGASRVLDSDADPEWKAIAGEYRVLARRLLREVSGRDREVLVRFYLKEQSQEEICSDMDLTATQFRLLKSRAKARLGTLGRKRLSRRRICW
jgi:RNA polymerase sigma factor (sigma-70 family)